MKAADKWLEKLDEATRTNPAVYYENPHLAKPRRVRLKSTKGWKLPPNTVKVGGKTKWDWPLKKEDCHIADLAPEVRINAYRRYILDAWDPKDASTLVEDFKELRGKNLACYCPEGEMCPHDVLLELVNQRT